jgi:hypothetical protein
MRAPSARLRGFGVSVSGCGVYCTSALTVNISKNDGKTFGGPIIVHENVNDPSPTAPGQTFNDKNWIVTDNYPKSPHYGRTYVVWDQVHCSDNVNCTAPLFQPAVLKYSDDGGRHWSKLIEATASQSGPQFQEVGVQPVVLPNGHVVVVYADVQAGVYTFTGSFKAIRSTDGGNTWSSPTTVASALAYAEESFGLRAPNVPSAFVRGKTIYVAFHHVPPGTSTTPVPNPTPNDIFLTKSTDEGLTWTTPVDVTLDPGVDHFTPDIAVAGGIVHLTYRAHTPTNVNADTNVAAVYRQVVNFVSGTPITLKVSDARYAARTTANQLKFFGDYAGIAAAACVAHPIWGQSESFGDTSPTVPTPPTHERAFSARIRYCRTTESEGGGDDRED